MKTRLSLLAALLGSAAGAAVLDKPADWRTNDGETQIVEADGRLAVKDGKFYIFSTAATPVKDGFKYTVRGMFSKNVSFGVQMFDADGKALHASCCSEIADTYTTLVQPVKKGDQTIRVKDALYWRSGGVGYNAQADGSDFPNRCSLGVSVKSVKKLAPDDWEVTLAGPSRADVPAGTGVRLLPGGPAYYFAQESREVKGGGCECVGCFANEAAHRIAKFFPGAASFRLVAYADLGKKTSVSWKDVSIVEEPITATDRMSLTDAGMGKPLSSPPAYDGKALNKVKFSEVPKHGDLKLIENGRLRFAIVAALKEEDEFVGPEGLKLQPGQKSVRQAVDVLTAGFRKACGKSPAVIEPDDPSLENWPCWIVVGPNVLTDKLGMKPCELPQEGFEIRTFDRGIAIAGMDGFRIPGKFDLYDFRSRRMNCNGTLWGAWDFRERFLDQRVYYGGAGEVMPRLSKDFAVRPVAYTDQPQYWNRGYHLNSGAFRAGNSSRFFGGESPHPHDVIREFPSKTNELFVTQNGKLQCDPKNYGNNFFDITNPVFAETLAGAFAKYFETKGKYNPFWGGTFIPNSEWCWFGQCDRGGLIDTEWSRPYVETNVANNSTVGKDGELCPTNYPDSARMSSVYADFFDRFGRLMAKAAPGRKVSCEVYSDYLFPPTKWDRKFPDNIRIMTCYGTPPMVVDKGYRKAYRRVYEGWGRLCADKVVPYIYSAGWSFGAGIQLSLQGWYMGDYLKEFADVIDNRNAYACLCGWTKAYFYTMNLCARAMWNPDFDKRAVMDEFFERFYAPEVAKPLKQFHDGVVEIWEKKTIPGNPDVNYSSLAGPRYANLYETFDEAWIRESWLLLDEARRAAVPGTMAGSRVEKFLDPWMDLFISRIDRRGQRMVTNVRPNRVPPDYRDGVFVWSDLAWNEADFRGLKEQCVGFAPKPVRANAYADEWYVHGGEITLTVAENPHARYVGMTKHDEPFDIPLAEQSAAEFSIEVKAAHHPCATEAEIAAAEPVEAVICFNGKELGRELLKEDKWQRLSYKIPAGGLKVGGKGNAVNVFAVSNLTTAATLSLPTSWLAVRKPELKVLPPAGTKLPGKAEAAPAKWFEDDTIFVQHIKKRRDKDPSLDYGAELRALAYGAFNSHVAWRLIVAFEEFNRCYAAGDFYESARKRLPTLFKEARAKTSKGSQERLRLEKLIAPYEKHLSRIENENKEDK